MCSDHAELEDDAFLGEDEDDEALPQKMGKAKKKRIRIMRHPRPLSPISSAHNIGILGTDRNHFQASWPMAAPISRVCGDVVGDGT